MIEGLVPDGTLVYWFERSVRRIRVGACVCSGFKKVLLLSTNYGEQCQINRSSGFIDHEDAKADAIQWLMKEGSKMAEKALQVRDEEPPQITNSDRTIATKKAPKPRKKKDDSDRSICLDEDAK